MSIRIHYNNIESNNPSIIALQDSIEELDFDTFGVDQIHQKQLIARLVSESRLKDQLLLSAECRLAELQNDLDRSRHTSPDDNQLTNLRLHVLLDQIGNIDGSLAQIKAQTKEWISNHSSSCAKLKLLVEKIESSNRVAFEKLSQLITTSPSFELMLQNQNQLSRNDQAIVELASEWNQSRLDFVSQVNSMRTSLTAQFADLKHELELDKSSRQPVESNQRACMEKPTTRDAYAQTPQFDTISPEQHQLAISSIASVYREELVRLTTILRCELDQRQVDFESQLASQHIATKQVERRLSEAVGRARRAECELEQIKASWISFCSMPSMIMASPPNQLGEGKHLYQLYRQPLVPFYDASQYISCNLLVNPLPSPKIDNALASSDSYQPTGARRKRRLDRRSKFHHPIRQSSESFLVQKTIQSTVTAVKM